mgnify:CR=1 FL=1
MAAPFASRERGHSPLFQTFPGLLGHVLGQAGLRQYAFEFAPHQRAARCVEALPATEGRHEAGGRLRIQSVQRNDAVRHQPVALARYVVERPLVAGERAIERADAVGIGEREVLVSPQFLDQIDRGGMGGEGLGLEPLVERQRVGPIAVVEDVERRDSLGAVAIGEDGEGRLPLGHIIGVVELDEGGCGAIHRA